MKTYRLVNDRVRGNLIQEINSIEIDAGKPKVIIIDDEKKQRTNRQNRYLWGVVYKTIADNDPGFFGSEDTEAALKAIGVTMEEAVHEYCKRHFLRGEVLHIADDGEGTDWQMYHLQKSTAALNKREFNEYVEAIRRWAAEGLQVFVPDPYQAGYEDLVWRGDDH